jgi:transcription initiation factor TFIIE subunit alpha
MGRRGFYELEIVKNFLHDVGGEMAYQVVQIHEKRGRSVTDEELAKKINVKVTEIRAVLNRLHFRGIAQYQKTKDKNSGWYSYTWDINQKRIAELLLDKEKEKVEKMESKMKFEENYTFFSCKKNCEFFPFEVATEYQFRCPGCGKNMEVYDNKKEALDLKKRLENLREELETLKEFYKNAKIRT